MHRQSTHLYVALFACFCVGAMESEGQNLNSEAALALEAENEALKKTVAQQAYRIKHLLRALESVEARVEESEASEDRK